MKKIFIILLVAISFVFFSCKKETVPATQTTDATTTATNTTKFADPGPTIFSSCNKWVVVSFSTSGVDQTANYSSSSLIFCPDHTFTISNDVMSRNGQWAFVSVGALGTLGFQMTFNDGDIPLDAWANLQDVWDVRYHTSNALSLQSSDGKREITIGKIIR